MLGACDVKDRDLLIEEASTSPAAVNASTNENLYRVFGHIVHITSTTGTSNCSYGFFFLLTNVLFNMENVKVVSFSFDFIHFKL